MMLVGWAHGHVFDVHCLSNGWVMNECLFRKRDCLPYKSSVVEGQIRFSRILGALWTCKSEKDDFSSHLLKRDGPNGSSSRVHRLVVPRGCNKRVLTQLTTRNLCILPRWGAVCRSSRRQALYFITLISPLLAQEKMSLCGSTFIIHISQWPYSVYILKNI